MSQGHLANHIQHPQLKSNNTLHVVGVCSNPVRWHSRYRIVREWIKHMLETLHVRLTMVEAAYGERSHELAPMNDEYDFIPLVAKSECWSKESMINIGFRHVAAKYNAQFLDWHDTDVFHRDPNWAQETLHQLQHYQVLQPWSDCADLNHQGGITRHFRSFGYQHQRGVPKQTHPSQPYEYAHTGFAWSCRRGFWEQVQGLMDFPILGSSDHHMGFGMIGEVDKTIHRGMAPSFFELCHEWQDRAVSITHKDVGFTPGRIEHQFHGPKNRRYYRERWQILVDYKFDPKKNLMRDAQGLVYLVGNPGLEQAIMKYNRSRFEDSIEEH